MEAMYEKVEGILKLFLRSFFKLLNGIYLTKGEGYKESFTCTERARAFNAWQQSWERESKGSWITHFIEDVRPWFNRG